jgi:hypothetical protein
MVVSWPFSSAEREKITLPLGFESSPADGFAGAAPVGAVCAINGIATRTAATITIAGVRAKGNFMNRDLSVSFV